MKKRNIKNPEFDKGLVIGLLLAFLTAIAIFAFGVVFDEKEGVSTERITLIQKAFEDCYLGVGQDDAQLYWKCDRYSVPIGVYACSKEKAEQGINSLVCKVKLGINPTEVNYPASFPEKYCEIVEGE